MAQCTGDVQGADIGDSLLISRRTHLRTDGPPATPSWGKIVSRGDEMTIYRSAGVEATKITYEGWCTLQVAWEPWTEPQDVARAINAVVPKGAAMRNANTLGFDSSMITYEGVCQVFHEYKFLQWEPLLEVALADVG